MTDLYVKNALLERAEDAVKSKKPDHRRVYQEETEVDLIGSYWQKWELSAICQIQPEVNSTP